MAAVALTGSGRIASAGRASARLSAVLRGSGRAASAGRAATGAAAARIEVELVALSDLTTTLATLDQTRLRSWTETLNDAGAFEITFQNDDADLALVESSTTVLNFYIDGVLAFSGIPENRDAVLVSPNDDAGQVTKWSGRGIAAIMDRFIQYPALMLGSRPVEEDRAYNWTSPTYDWVGNGAVAATAIDTVANAQAGSMGQPWDADFADPGADVLGPSSGTTSTAPTGSWYPEQTVTIVTDGSYELQNLMDNWGEVIFDGAQVASPGQEADPTSESSFTTMTRTTLELTAGLHALGARVYNAALPPSNANDPTGWAFTVVAQNADGTLGAIAGSSAVAAGALVIEYPAAPPGMTHGQAILDFFDECANGTSLGGGRATGDPLAAVNLITFSFTGVLDTAGNPWTSSPEIATKIGTSGLTFLKELSASGIDWYMAPGTTVLDAWVAGGRGSASGVDFHSPTNESDPTSGNLIEHVETSEG